MPRCRAARELGEGQHGAGIGGLVVLGDEFHRLAEHAAGLVDRVQRDLGARQREAPASAPVPVTGSTMPIRTAELAP